MIYKGEFQFDISGKSRGVKFGTLANALFCKMEGIKPIDIQQRIVDNDPFIDIDYFFYAALAYNKIHNIDVDFTKDDVSCWMDEIGVNKIAEMITEAFQSYTPKNV